MRFQYLSLELAFGGIPPGASSGGEPSIAPVGSRTWKRPQTGATSIPGPSRSWQRGLRARQPQLLSRLGGEGQTLRPAPPRPSWRATQHEGVRISERFDREDRKNARTWLRTVSGRSRGRRRGGALCYLYGLNRDAGPVYVDDPRAWTEQVCWCYLVGINAVRGREYYLR